MDCLEVLLLSFSFLVILKSSLSNGQVAVHSCSNNLGMYAKGSIYQENLYSLLSSVVSDNQVDYGFYNLSVGKSPDQVNAIALCRGDVSLNDCHSCLNNSTYRILQDCPNQKEAIGFHLVCMLLYSNRSLSGIIGGFPPLNVSNPHNVSNLSTFNSALGSLFQRLQSKAASGNSVRRFATGTQVAGSDTIYGLMQCTPNLLEKECADCLGGIFRQIEPCCEGKKGGRVLVPSCNLRFELFRFYEVTADDTTASSQSPPMLQSPPPLEEKKSKRKTERTKIIIFFCTISIGISVVCICIILRLWKPKKNSESCIKDSATMVQLDGTESAEPHQFDFDTIRAATNDFSEENKLGQGGFGAVYKGTFYNKQDIAVKRLSTSSGQGNLEFKNEVLIVAKLEHRNLVRLLGFCLEGNERLLVYEFVPNSSLDHFIFDPVKRVCLDWDMRCKIIEGIARGLLYLHEDSRLRIIHRDLKASNVLLDEEMNPKISDFGMARLVLMDQSQDCTSRIVGTYGYMAPEYMLHGQFSVRSDVFSFGVLVLEILTGQKNGSFRNGEFEHLLSNAWENWMKGIFLDLIDPTIRTSGSRTEMMRFFHIALLCVQENVTTRPTMASVVTMLNSHSLTLPVPSKPAFYMNSTYELQTFGPSETETKHPSKNDASVTISDLYPR